MPRPPFRTFDRPAPLSQAPLSHAVSDGSMEGFPENVPCRVVLPIHHEAAYAYPLIIWLHDRGGDHRQVQRVMPLISSRNYVGIGIRGTQALDPAGHHFGWSETHASTFTVADRVDAAVRRATSLSSIHPGRIVIAGYRQGGQMALRLAAAEPDRYAAAIAIDTSELTWTGCDLAALQKKNLPVLVQRFADDVQTETQAFEEQLQQLRTLGMRVEAQLFAGEPSLCTEMLRGIDRWIMNRIVGGDWNDWSAPHASTAPCKPWEAALSTRMN